MRTIKFISIWIIILGTIAVALNFAWPNTITFITQKTNTYDPTTIYYVYNMRSYLQNIQIAAQKTTYLQLDMPTREWQTGAFELIGITQQISNNLAVMLDYSILALNIVLFPFRIIAYIVQILMAVIGLNIYETNNNAFSWLIELTNWFIDRLQIPYV